MHHRFLLLLLLLMGYSAVAHATNPVDTRLKELVKHFEAKGVDINPFLEDSRFSYIEGITKKFTRSAERRIETLDDYKRVIGFDGKKNRISYFYSEYHNELKAAEKEYGIPKEVIIGIIAIESDFGKNSGTYNPFNVYVSMYVEDYRTEWSLSQLEELLEFAQKKEMDLMGMKSSYAGAMSYAQFIPWSLNRFWVGSELYHMPDNINSVANYLRHYKEVTGSVEQSIYRYNPSKLYQGAVLALAEEAKAIIN